MTISINTSEYTKEREVEIDGVGFKMRPLTSAESLALTQFQRDVKKAKNEKAVELLEKMLDLMYGLYDQPERAREVLGKLPPDAIFEIYSKVMKGEA